MVEHGLPLQFLNLGGEMLYIIDQRLRAQEVPCDRAAKVRNDILSIMLNRRFIEEVFKPQPLYSKAALRGVFERLAHGSIMRLNTVSMDKLFDLMMMALKQQVVQAKRPQELLLATLNHLDALRGYATSAPVASLLDQALVLFLKTYIDMPEGDLAEIRRLLLEFVQDMQTRVSIFLREGIQTAEGRFVLPVEGPVPPNSEMPGLIRYFDSSGELLSTAYFPHGGDFKPPEPPASLDPSPRPRGTNLGINLYAVRDNVCEETKDSRRRDGDEVPEPTYMREEGQSVELNLLAQLLRPSSDNTTFRLNLFPGDGEEDDEGAAEEEQVLLVRREGSRAPELQQLLEDLSVEDTEEKEMDLLELLDSTT
ncbi:Organic solute carrier protein 1 [Trinorchestia longiramus]|nr:Organic solute carrier protein 1 [Trinorchestia longiramus]